MPITLLLLIILVIRWVCEHWRNKPLQDMFLTYRKVFKMPRCNSMVISWWICIRERWAPYDYADILPLSQSYPVVYVNKKTHKTDKPLPVIFRVCVSHVIQITQGLLVNVAVRWSYVLALQLNPKRQKTVECFWAIETPTTLTFSLCVFKK